MDPNHSPVYEQFPKNTKIVKNGSKIAKKSFYLPLREALLVLEGTAAANIYPMPEYLLSFLWVGFTPRLEDAIEEHLPHDNGPE